MAPSKANHKRVKIGCCIITITALIHIVFYGDAYFWISSIYQQYDNNDSDKVTPRSMFKSLYSMKQTNITRKPAYVPALVLLGPPKAGTRSFVNTLSKYSNIEKFGREFGFWTSGNQWKCYPRWNQTEWSIFIENYSSTTQNLSYFIAAMKSYKQNKKCTLSKYFSWYLQLNRSCDLNKCYYIEKTPIYARTPWIPIIYSNMMPKVKLITIIRNPINHIWSNVFAFTAKGRSKSNIKKGLNYIEHWIIDQIKESFSFNKLSKICKDINIKWNQLKNEDKELRHSILIKNEYKQYVVEYLKLKFVSPRDINRGTRQQMFIWAPVLLPNFLIGLLSYEYELGIYNHFKMIQFEYIYSNTADAMSQIRCWISGICGIDDQEKHYLFQTVERTNPASKNNTFSTWYQQQIHQLFDDCSQILLNILLIDRRDLLIGDWITWN